MLSRLAPTMKIGSSSLKTVMPLRVASTNSPAISAIPSNLPTKQEGPERDLVNFPRPKQPAHPGKVRLAFVPEEWFQFFYKKTGVTGPYVFGAGLTTYLLSKEIWVIEHEFWNAVSLFILLGYGIKKFGPQVAVYLDKEIDKEVEELTEGQKQAVKNYEDSIESEKTEQWRAKGQTILFDAKKENVALQLEAEYRKRVMTTYLEVKKRLDYQVMIINAKRQAEHNHLANWVYGQVLSSITSQQEADTLKQCIVDLKALATKA